MTKSSSETIASGSDTASIPETSTIERVMQSMHDDLVFGHFKPRQRLIESELIVRYDVSRSIVRRVLDEMERRGIVSRVPNKGAVVHDFSLKEVRDICDVRILLHRHAIETLPLPADAAWLSELEAQQADHAEAVERRDIAAAYRLNKAFHTTFFSAAPNVFLRKQIDEINWLMDVVRSYRMLGPALNKRAPREHRGIVEAAAAGDRARLIDLCVSHVPSADEIYDRIGTWSGR